MAKQLEIIKFRDLITITSIPRLVPGFEIPTVEIIGDDFSSVDKVIINDMPCPEFIIINLNTLYAQLPDSLIESISKIEVVSSRFTKFGTASRISYEIGNKTRTVNGILKLVQLFTKWMLQTPGSDIFNPERGGGLQDMVGKLVSSRNMEPILTALTRSVENTTTQIRSAQINVPDLPADERLLAAEVINLDTFEETMEARARVQLQSVAGTAAISSLSL